MAFYPDELSPIDRIRSLGQPTDALPDIASLKNRRQWKSLVLGKKDMGINNFATITEEKEEEISSDGSQGTNSNKGSVGSLAVSAGVVANKKITFPKPRKYITSRVSDRKEEAPPRGVGNPVPFAPLGAPLKECASSGIDLRKTDFCTFTGSPKPSAPEAKQSPKVKKSKEMLVPAQELVESYVLSETPIECQWKEAVSDGQGMMGWSRSGAEKTVPSKHEGVQGSKGRPEEKRKSVGSSKVAAVAEAGKKEAKAGKKKGSGVAAAKGKSPKEKEEAPLTYRAEKAAGGKGKQKAEKGKTLNMKEVVNVYKNLAYGSKEEIKSFVENLSFVKDESKAESDKNLLSMMNLKVLENKIKSFAKKSGKGQEASTSQEKKAKPERLQKKGRKAHIERLARHKVVKVPAVLNKNYAKPSGESTASDKASEQRGKRGSSKDKEPWKYVGMESVLDKTYFVYPAYPPSVNLKKGMKGRKACAKGTEKPLRERNAGKASEAEPKVKGPQVVLRANSIAGGGTRSHGLNVARSLSNKSMSRPSATTVCTVEFRPAVGQKAEEPPVGAPDQSLLVYLHGTKAIHVKSPYSDKQFSRVKFFRKDERGMPLIKGLGRRAPPGGGQNVSVRNISLPGKLTRVRSLDLLDFDEDIENITEFLRSQDTPDRQRPEECQGVKKSERNWWPKESPKEGDPVAPRHQRRQRRNTHQLHHHLPHLHPHHHHRQHPTSQETLSPDSIIAEISNNIQHLQYLPDTEDNRKMIAHFFDELDQRIEASRKGTLALQKLPSPSGPESFRPIPILGY